MDQDQVFVPNTRSQAGLKPFDPTKEDLFGSRVSEEVKREMWEALGDSPIGAVIGSATYLVRYSIITSTPVPYLDRTARWMACIYHQECIWSAQIS